ncbi:MAG TPA: amidohydrolase family protein [Stellaceae bacterium]|nr:amidohydrolase family protein [Stellaceae bacterium]
MTVDLILRNTRLADRPDAPPHDIGVAGGRIAAIEPSLPDTADSYDCGGRMVCAGFVETHIHLDKSRIIDRCSPEIGREARAVARVAAVKHTMSVEDVHTRARATLEQAILHGTTRMRTHVEIDPGIGLRGYEGVAALIDEYKWAIDLEICAFPQEGLTNNPGTYELIAEALRRGARAVGAAPGYDTDHPGQIRQIFALARAFGAEIDMHLDFGNEPRDLDVELVCDLTEAYGMGGRVAVGHMTKLAVLPPAELARVVRRLGDAGVAVTVLPATDLFLMGRDQDHAVRRGVADANLLVEHGVNCSISSNNILNPFTPFGDCSLIRMANLHANVSQISGPDRLAECFDMLTTRSARLLNLDDYGLKVGNPADLAVIGAETREQAVAELREPVAVWKRGRRTVTRPRPELHLPN